MTAIANVAKAKGINDTARRVNIKHEHLYEDLSTNSSPNFDIVKQLIESF
ncbi:putative transcriptional regulator [Candidatus Magnetomorum sp. HK-1]|nr:putative transcriptional regulator [Candidatus Magnetomorum sp. HK-1]